MVVLPGWSYGPVPLNVKNSEVDPKSDTFSSAVTVISV